MRISDWSSDVCSSDLQEHLQLFPGRHRRRAAVARDHDRAAGVGVAAARVERFVAQPAAQEAGHERIASAEHVEHVHLEALADHAVVQRSEEHTSELQSLMRISYAVFCLKKKNTMTTSTKREDSYTTD